MARRTLEEAIIWPTPPTDPRRPRSRWTFVGLGVMVLALALAFLIRGICWEAVAMAAPVWVGVVLVGRLREILLTVGIVVVTALGLLVVEGVNVITYHSVFLTGA